jgi:hypothetical protein
MQIEIPPQTLSGPKDPVDDLLTDLTKQLNDNPIEQQVPLSPPSRDEYEAVCSKAKSLGIEVLDTPAESLVLGGEIVRRSTLLIGRVGLSKDRRVLSVLFRATKKTRAYIFYPSPKLDALELGKMIFWGIAACVPEALVQSRIVEIPEFLRVNTCDLESLIGMSDEQRAVESALRATHKTQADEAMQLRRCESSRDSLLDKLDQVNDELLLQKRSLEAESNRAFYWQMAALCSVALLLIAVLAIWR